MARSPGASEVLNLGQSAGEHCGLRVLSGYSLPWEGNPTLKENSGPNQENPGLRRTNLAHRQCMSPTLPMDWLLPAWLMSVCLSCHSFSFKETSTRSPVSNEPDIQGKCSRKGH